MSQKGRRLKMPKHYEMISCDVDFVEHWSSKALPPDYISKPFPPQDRARIMSDFAPIAHSGSTCLRALRQPDLLDFDWVRTRLDAAVAAIHDSTDVDPEIRGGVVVLKGTRMPVFRILAEFTEDYSAAQIAEEYSLDHSVIKQFLMGLSIYFERSFKR